MRDSQTILAEALQRSFERGTAPETLFTIAPEVWGEIARVAAAHRCETVLLGAPRVIDPGVEARLEGLLSTLEADAVVVRAPHRWRIAQVRRVLVPMGGHRDHSRLRARLLASLTRSEGCTITFLRIVPPGTPAEVRRRAERDLVALARDEAEGQYDVVVEEASAIEAAILARAAETDLVVLGMRPGVGSRRAIGELGLAILRQSEVPVVMLGSRRGRLL